VNKEIFEMSSSGFSRPQDYQLSGKRFYILLLYSNPIRLAFKSKVMAGHCVQT